MTWNLIRIVTVVGALLLAGCLEMGAEDECPSCEQAARSDAHIEQAKAFFAQGDYRRGTSQCRMALEEKADSADGHFCSVVGQVGLLVGHVSELMNMAYMDLSPASVMPMSDPKPLVVGLLDSLERTMMSLDQDLHALASLEEPTFYVPSAPMALKVGSLGNSFYHPSHELTFNLGGTWDKTQILLLGAGVNGVQAILDYALAHSLKTAGKLESQGPSLYAEAFVRSPSLLLFDTDSESQARLTGNEQRKGLANDVIAMLSYLYGREDEIEDVAPANTGLREAIRLSAASEVTEPVMGWTDRNGDGHPEGVRIEFLSDMIAQVTGVSIPLFVNVFSPDTMDRFYALLGDLMENIEGQGDPVGVAELLESARQDIWGFLPAIGPAVRPVPDLVYLSPGDFLADPLPVRRMMPYFFSNLVHGYVDYVLLYETKRYDDWYDETSVEYYRFAWGTWRAQRYDDFRIFPEENLEHAQSDEFVPMPTLELADDGLRPDAVSPILPYLAYQSPSFGGLLWLNPLAFDDGFQVAPASQASLNTSVARAIQYYCVNLSPFYSSAYYTYTLDTFFGDCQ